MEIFFVVESSDFEWTLRIGKVVYEYFIPKLNQQATETWRVLVAVTLIFKRVLRVSGFSKKSAVFGLESKKKLNKVCL